MSVKIIEKFNDYGCGDPDAVFNISEGDTCLDVCVICQKQIPPDGGSIDGANAYWNCHKMLARITGPMYRTHRPNRPENSSKASERQ